MHPFEDSQQHNQLQAAQYSQPSNFQPEWFEALYDSFPFLLNPPEESFNHSTVIDFSLPFGDTEQYRSNQADSVDMFGYCNFENTLPDPSGLEERQSRDPATETVSRWPQGHIDLSRAGVDKSGLNIGRTALNALRICCSGHEFDSPQSAIDKINGNVRHDKPFTGIIVTLYPWRTGNRAKMHNRLCVRWLRS